MGIMSRMKVLGYVEAVGRDGETYYFLPKSRRKKQRKVTRMGQYTNRERVTSQYSKDHRYAAEDLEFRTRYPAVFEFMAEVVKDDGKRRETSTLTVVCENGSWKFKFTDRGPKGSEFDHVVWITVATFQEGLDALNHALVNDDAEWKPFKKFNPRK